MFQDLMSSGKGFSSVTMMEYFVFASLPLLIVFSRSRRKSNQIFPCLQSISGICARAQSSEQTATQKTCGQIPGPRGIPLFGNLFQVDRSRLPQVCFSLSQTFGSIFKLRLFNKNIVVLSSIKTIRSAFSNSNINDRPINSTKYFFYDRKHMGFADLREETLGLRAFHHRDLQLYFSGKEKYEQIYKTELEKFVLKSRTFHGSDFNPDKPLLYFLTNMYSSLLTGRSFPEEDEGHSCIWEFIDLLYQMMDPSVDGPLRMFPFLRFLPGKFGNLFRQTTAARDKVAKKYFEEQKATYDHGQIRGLVDVCLKTQRDEIDANGTTWLTDEYIKGLIYDTLGAGMTEMLKTLRLFLLLMTQNQNCQAKMRLEVDDVVGRHEFPSLSKRSQMPYSQAVILETLRYISQTPFAIPHRCSKDVELDGYLIEKDTVILPNLWGIHHDEEIWGDPWEFRPERFLDDRGQLLPQDHIYMQTLIPFSVGRRQCPGQDFAKSRLFLCLTYLVQQLIILPAEGAPMPSTDPREYTSKYPMYHPQFECRLLPRDSL